MRLEIPPGDFAGYIFDLDGTLVDTMPLHYQAWNEAFRQLGLRTQLDEALFYSLGGMPAIHVAGVFNRQMGTDLDAVELRRIKEQRFAELLPQAPLIGAVVDYARAVAESRPVSVASGGPRDAVMHTLHLTGLDVLFNVVVSADDVAHGKPAPDTFLLAAQQMGVPPARCLVFEDAEFGIQAARAAGMQWVRIPAPIRTPTKPD